MYGLINRYTTPIWGNSRGDFLPPPTCHRDPCLGPALECLHPHRCTSPRRGHRTWRPLMKVMEFLSLKLALNDLEIKWNQGVPSLILHCTDFCWIPRPLKNCLSTRTRSTQDRWTCWISWSLAILLTGDCAKLLSHLSHSLAQHFKLVSSLP